MLNDERGNAGRFLLLIFGFRMAGMKRAGRIVLNGLTGLSLILAVLVALMWVRRYWGCDEVEALVSRKNDVPFFGFSLYRNRLDITVARIKELSGTVSHLNYMSSPPHRDRIWPHTCLGVGWAWPVISWSNIVSWTEIGIPYAHLLALFSLLPAIRLYRWLRRRKLNRPGHCVTCGYDLRATPDRCPECGTPAPAPPSTLGPSTAAGA